MSAPSTWNGHEVAVWLEQSGLKAFKDNFLAADIDGSLLFDLDEEMLRDDLDVQDAAARQAFFSARDKLSADAPVVSMSSLYDTPGAGDTAGFGTSGGDYDQATGGGAFSDFYAMAAADGADSTYDMAELGDALYDNAAVDPSYLAVEPDGEYLDMEPEDADPGYLAVNPDWLEEQHHLLEHQPWFRGGDKYAGYSRKSATKELTKTAPGTFVVRVSQSEPGHYAISVMRKKGSITSMLILPSYGGADSIAPGHTVYRLGTYSKLIFNTVPKLLAYYIAHPYFDGEHLVGEVKPEAASQGGGYILVSPDQEEPAPGYLTVNTDGPGDEGDKPG